MRARAVVRRTLLVVGAWLPFFLFWVLFYLSYAGERQSLATALSSAFAAIGSAALLSIAVWRFCARNPWPLVVRPSFYLKHLAAASAYGVTWILAMYGGEGAFQGRNFFDDLVSGFSSRVMLWQFLMGVWLYGLIAGVAYGIQTRRRANESENRALRAEAALVGARLEALRSRLNPHFLFNALHTAEHSRLTSFFVEGPSAPDDARRGPPPSGRESTGAASKPVDQRPRNNPDTRPPQRNAAFPRQELIDQDSGCDFESSTRPPRSRI